MSELGVAADCRETARMEAWASKAQDSSTLELYVTMLSYSELSSS